MKINIISDTKIRDAGIDLEVIHFCLKKFATKQKYIWNL